MYICRSCDRNTHTNMPSNICYKYGVRVCLSIWLMRLCVAPQFFGNWTSTYRIQLYSFKYSPFLCGITTPVFCLLVHPKTQILPEKIEKRNDAKRKAHTAATADAATLLPITIGCGYDKQTLNFVDVFYVDVRVILRHHHFPNPTSQRIRMVFVYGVVLSLAKHSFWSWNVSRMVTASRHRKFVGLPPRRRLSLRMKKIRNTHFWCAFYIPV